MKTLKTLLALSLLVSSFAPVCAQEVLEEAAQGGDNRRSTDREADSRSGESSDTEEAQGEGQEAQGEGQEAQGEGQEAQAEAKGFSVKAHAFFDPKVAAVKDFYAFDKNAKVKSFAKYGVTAAAIAAVIGGSYALYNYLFADEESEEEGIDEAPVVPEAPVDEPRVNTTPVAPVAPVVVKPAPASNNGGPRRGRGCRKNSKKTSSARAKRCGKKSSCGSKGCK